MITTVLAVAALAAGFVLMWSVRGLPPARGPAAASITVVVPARDEAHRLPRLLETLAWQGRPADRVVVVDDGSTDATAAIARAAGAHVVSTGGPPDGWTGKTWACHVGAEHAAADAEPDGVVVFLDADVFLAPDAIARLVAAHAASAENGLLSVQPYHVTARSFEQLSAIANLVAVMASGLAAMRPASSQAVAFGPCLVTTHRALAAVGGFAAVRADTIEDLGLAARYREDERTVRCVAGRETVQFRMYEDGVRPLVRGWTKNLAGGARRAALGPVLGATVWVAGACAVTVGVVTDPSPVRIGWFLAIAAQLAWMLPRVGRFQPWTSVLFPIPLLAFVAMFVASAVRRGVLRSVSWSGRQVEVPRS